MKKEIDPAHAGWILHTTLCDSKGNSLDQQFYQMTSSTDMLKLLKERKEAKQEWENDKGFPTHYHLHLCQLLNYNSAGLLIKTFVTEEDLELYAKNEQNLIDSYKA